MGQPVSKVEVVQKAYEALRSEKPTEAQLDALQKTFEAEHGSHVLDQLRAQVDVQAKEAPFIMANLDELSRRVGTKVELRAELGKFSAELKTKSDAAALDAGKKAEAQLKESATTPLEKPVQDKKAPAGAPKPEESHTVRNVLLGTAGALGLIWLYRRWKSSSEKAKQATEEVQGSWVKKWLWRIGIGTAAFLGLSVAYNALSDKMKKELEEQKNKAGAAIAKLPRAILGDTAVDTAQALGANTKKNLENYKRLFTGDRYITLERKKEENDEQYARRCLDYAKNGGALPSAKDFQDPEEYKKWIKCLTEVHVEKDREPLMIMGDVVKFMWSQGTNIFSASTSMAGAVVDLCDGKDDAWSTMMKVYVGEGVPAYFFGAALLKYPINVMLGAGFKGALKDAAIQSLTWPYSIVSDGRLVCGVVGDSLHGSQSTIGTLLKSSAQIPGYRWDSMLSEARTVSTGKPLVGRIFAWKPDHVEALFKEWEKWNQLSENMEKRMGKLPTDSTKYTQIQRMQKNGLDRILARRESIAAAMHSGIEKINMGRVVNDYYVPKFVHAHGEMSSIQAALQNTGKVDLSVWKKNLPHAFSVSVDPSIPVAANASPAASPSSAPIQARAPSALPSNTPEPAIQQPGARAVRETVRIGTDKLGQKYLPALTALVIETPGLTKDVMEALAKDKRLAEYFLGTANPNARRIVVEYLSKTLNIDEAVNALAGKIETDAALRSGLNAGKIDASGLKVLFEAPSPVAPPKGLLSRLPDGVRNFFKPENLKSVFFSPANWWRFIKGGGVGLVTDVVVDKVGDVGIRKTTDEGSYTNMVLKELKDIGRGAVSGAAAGAVVGGTVGVGVGAVPGYVFGAATGAAINGVGKIARLNKGVYYDLPKAGLEILQGNMEVARKEKLLTEKQAARRAREAAKQQFTSPSTIEAPKEGQGK